MRVSFIVITLLAILCSIVVCQEVIDVVYLKNGDIVKGIIIENVPNNYIRIELEGGSILTYQYTEIEKFARELRTKGTVQPKHTEQNIIIQQQQQQVHPPTNNPTQPSYITDAQKLMMYESQKKSPTTAVLLSCLLSSAGHAYAGNWGRGLLFTAGRFACMYIAITLGIEEKTYDFKFHEDYTVTETNEVYTLGMIGTLVLAIWEMVDASNEVKKYNEKLYNRIFHGQPSFGMKTVPANNGIQLFLAYNF